MFKLAHGYLNDADYFADGAVPSQEQVLADEGLSPEQREEIFRRVREHGALFVQVMDPTPNTPAYEQRPIEYDPGNFFWDPIPDNVVEGIFGQGRKWTGEDDGLSFAVLADEHPLVPGDVPVILQAKRSLGDAWADAATPVGSWSLPLTDARFFRAVFKWHD